MFIGVQINLFSQQQQSHDLVLVASFYIYKFGQTPDTGHRTKPKLEACATRTA